MTRSSPASGASRAPRRPIRSVTTDGRYGPEDGVEPPTSRAVCARSASSSSVAPSRRSSARTRSVDSPLDSAAATDATADAYQRSTRARVASRYRPPNAPVRDPRRWYSRRAARAMIAKAASRRRCHSHQLKCQFRLTSIAMSASASRTTAAAIGSRIGSAAVPELPGQLHRRERVQADGDDRQRVEDRRPLRGVAVGHRGAGAGRSSRPPTAP